MTTTTPTRAKAAKAKAPTTGRTTRPKVAAIAAPETDVLVRLVDETATDYVVRVSALPVQTDETLAAVKAVIMSEDMDALRSSFESRIARSFMVGHHIVAVATLRNGAKPESFDDVSAGLGITAKGGGKYLGRAYSTLRECYDVGTFHRPAVRESYLAAYAASTVSEEYPDGLAAPESVRDYVSWARAEKRGGATAAKNTVDTLRTRRATAEANAAKAVDESKARADRAKVLVSAGTVEGCPLTGEQWSSMSEQVLVDVVLFAKALATAKGEARRTAEREARKLAAAAETGPQPASTPSVKVLA